MKRLDRYILKELAVPFLIGTVAVTLMFMANLLIYLLKELELQNVPPAALAQLILYKTPYFLNMTLPVGMALAGSLAMSRLARESEITAMRGAGASVLRIIWPVVMFGVLVAIGNWLVVEKAMPPAEREFQNIKRKVGVLASSPTYRANAVIYLGNYTATFDSVSRGPEGSVDLQGIILIEKPHPEETVLYKAASGTYKEGIWLLNKTVVYNLRDNELVGYKVRNQLKIDDKIIIDDLFAPTEAEEQTADELRQAIAEAKGFGRQTTALEIAYHIRYAVPAACMIFALLGPALAVAFARSGAFVGVLLSVILVFAYYNVHVVSTQILGRNEAVSPIVAAWLPNAIFFLVGLWFIRRLE
jgi:lipopolysaccharide export system permease protein